MLKVKQMNHQLQEKSRNKENGVWELERKVEACEAVLRDQMEQANNNQSRNKRIIDRIESLTEEALGNKDRVDRRLAELEEKVVAIDAGLRDSKTVQRNMQTEMQSVGWRHAENHGSLAEKNRHAEVLLLEWERKG